MCAQAKACPDSDMSPCPPLNGGEPWTRVPIQWPDQIFDDDRFHPAVGVAELAQQAQHAQQAAAGIGNIGNIGTALRLR